MSILKKRPRFLGFDGTIILGETVVWIFYLSRILILDDTPVLTLSAVLNGLLFVAAVATIVPGLPIALALLLKRMKTPPELRFFGQFFLLLFLMVTAPVLIAFAACAFSHSCL